MPIISANTLFHFTSKIEFLLSILENGFRPSYSPEFGDSIGGKINPVEIPMVCFCDLPISSLSKHIGLEGQNGYGKFGLGMSKAWGIKKQLNPVAYATELSHYMNNAVQENNHLRRLHDILIERAQNIVDDKFPQIFINDNGVTNYDESKFYESLTDHERTITGGANDVIRALEANVLALNYIKPYEDAITKRRYYDEREWRWVVPPSYDSKQAAGTIFINIKDEKPGRKEFYQQNILKYHMLTFDAGDIKYIILENDQHVATVNDKLRSLPSKFSQEDINRLLGRIVTCDQIQEDF